MKKKYIINKLKMADHTKDEIEEDDILEEMEEEIEQIEDEE